MDEQQITALVAAYKDAIERIRTELLRLDLTDMSRANTTAALREVAAILSSLNAEAAEWVTVNVPEAARYGVVQSIVSLGAAETAEAAEKIAKFNRINRDMVAAAVADTQADLLAVTQNVDRRVKSVIRKVAADSMRANMTAGINGQRTISRDILTNMRKELGSAVDTGIIDAAGRRWKPSVYVEMLTRTKIHATSREASVNEAIDRGAYYGVISKHGATDACRDYEGKTVKLVPDAPGDYAYIGDLPRNRIFHPNCRHTVTPIRQPAVQPENPLPNTNNAIIPEEKLLGYALNLDHKVGKNKAIVFDRVLGYNATNWKHLVENVKGRLPYAEAIARPKSAFGTPYSVPLELTGPNGRKAKVITAWLIRDGEDFPRLTSIYVDD